MEGRSVRLAAQFWRPLLWDSGHCDWYPRSLKMAPVSVHLDCIYGLIRAWSLTNFIIHCHRNCGAIMFRLKDLVFGTQCSNTTYNYRSWRERNLSNFLKSLSRKFIKSLSLISQWFIESTSSACSGGHLAREQPFLRYFKAYCHGIK